MEVRPLSPSRIGLSLLFVLLLGIGRLTKATPTVPCEWATSHLDYDPIAFNCSGQGLEIRSSDASHHTLDLSSSDLFGILPRLTSMAYMNLSHSCIVEVHEAAFAGFWDIEELDLSCNYLHTIRDGTLKGLGQLKTLDLKHNRISEVHRYAFTVLEALQIIWLQNNKLDAIPEAISGLADLRVLSVANNQISWVDSKSFHSCRSLTALHLQNNRIVGVSVDAFKDLMKLQMLNLSTNLLETMPGSTLESLWGKGTDIHLHGNPWRCNCSLAELRDQAPTWLTGRVLCHGGAMHGVPLSSLALGQLTCKRTLRVSQTLTADIMEGTALRIPCGNATEGGEAQYWHTPFGRLENNSVQGSGQPVAMLRDGSLKITSATPYHAGLYYCLWAAKEDRVIHPYRVECAPSTPSGGRRPRKTREAEGHQETVSAEHFTAAVASAVVVTFLVAFPVGAFSRGHLSRCFQRVRCRQRRGSSGGVDTGAPRWHYENDTFQKGGRSEEAEPSEGAPPEASADQGTAYLEGGDGSRESQGEAGAQTGPTGGRGGNGGEGSAAETGTGGESSARPSKRRVIKVYNYDEEGNKYDHVREPEDGGAPEVKQRTLSLTRLNAIMAGATTPAFSEEPLPGGAVEKPGDGRPVFHLSI